MITNWYHHCAHTRGNTNLFHLHRHKSTTQSHCSHRLFQLTYQIYIQSTCHWLEVQRWHFWCWLVTFATLGRSTKYTYLYYKTVSFHLPVPCPCYTHPRTHTHARTHMPAYGPLSLVTFACLKLKFCMWSRKSIIEIVRRFWLFTN